MSKNIKISTSFVSKTLILIGVIIASLLIAAEVNAQSIHYYLPPENTTPTRIYNINNNASSTTNSSTTTSPVINSITPNEIQKGNGIPAVAISGYNFNRTSIARWDGSDRITNYIDSNHLVIQLYASDITSKTHSVTVRNQSSGTVSNSASFVVKPMASEIMASMVKRTPARTTTNTNSTVVTNYVEDSTTTDNSISSLGANAISGGSGFLPSGLIQWVIIALLILVGVILWRRLVRGEYESTPLKHA